MTVDLWVDPELDDRTIFSKHWKEEVSALMKFKRRRYTSIDQSGGESVRVK